MAKNKRNNSDIEFSYLDIDLLKKFISSDTGKIIGKRTTGLSAKMQRSLQREIKRARLLALLPFCDLHT